MSTTYDRHDRRRERLQARDHAYPECKQPDCDRVAWIGPGNDGLCVGHIAKGRQHLRRRAELSQIRELRAQAKVARIAQIIADEGLCDTKLGRQLVRELAELNQTLQPKDGR